MSLRTRLFALIGGTVAATVVLVTWTVSSSAHDAFAALDAQRTAALVAEFRREFAREGEAVVARLDRIASADTVLRIAMDVAADARGRRTSTFAEHVNDAATLAAAQGLDFLDIVADDGTIVSSAEWPARFGYRHPWAVAAASASGAFLQSVELPRDGAIGLVAVRTVVAGGRPVHLAGGRRLDQQLLRSLPLPPGMRALLSRDASGELAALSPLVARVRQTRVESTGAVDLTAGRETFTAIPLAGRNGAVLDVLLVGSSGREEAALVSRIRWSGLLFGGLGVLFGFAVSYAVASRVTRPVERLAEAANEVAAGRWDVSVGDVGASGEIEQLARAFDTMTRQLVDQRERLIQAERVAAWRELARRLAHELKNPLFPLRIAVDNLRRAKALSGAEFDEVFEESLATLTTGLANLNTVIARFSDFSKMPAPQFADVSINAIVAQAVQLFRAQADAPGRPAIGVAVSFDESLPPVRGDAEQLGRAAQNLLLNAIDAMPSGGQLAVRTSRVDGAVRIDVSDTGVGLTAEERSRLFTPYYTTKQHGTGLGLAIVQATVADHNGRIWVESEQGRGTTFHIELPINPQ